MVSIGLAGAHVQPVLETKFSYELQKQALSPWPLALSWWGSRVSLEPGKL